MACSHRRYYTLPCFFLPLIRDKKKKLPIYRLRNIFLSTFQSLNRSFEFLSKSSCESFTLRNYTREVLFLLVQSLFLPSKNYIHFETTLRVNIPRYYLNLNFSCRKEKLVFPSFFFLSFFLLFIRARAHTHTHYRHRCVTRWRKSNQIRFAETRWRVSDFRLQWHNR